MRYLRNQGIYCDMKPLAVLGVVFLATEGCAGWVSAIRGVKQSVFDGQNLDPGEIPGGSPVQYCSIDDDNDDNVNKVIDIEYISLVPNPPRRGETLNIVANATTYGEIDEGAYIDVVVKLGLIKLLTQRFDLCEEVSEIDLSCPVKGGPKQIVKDVEMPKMIPPGTYDAIANAYTKDDEFIVCLKARITFGLN